MTEGCGVGVGKPRMTGRRYPGFVAVVAEYRRFTGPLALSRVPAGFRCHVRGLCRLISTARSDPVGPG